MHKHQNGNDRALSAGWSPYFRSLHQQFREDFNSQNPSLPLNEFRASTAVPTKPISLVLQVKLMRIVCFYSAGARYLKNQKHSNDWLPIQGPEQKAAKAKAQEYMQR